MLRRFCSVAVSVFFAAVLLGGFGISVQTASAQDNPFDPDFFFHISWGKQVDPGNYRDEYQVGSSVTRTFHSRIHSPANGSYGVTQTLSANEVISDSFQHHVVDQITLLPHKDLAPFLLSYVEPDCSPGTDFVLLKEGIKVRMMVSNVTTQTVGLKVQNHGYNPEFHTLVANSGGNFNLTSGGYVTIYSDTDYQTVCAVLWWDFDRIDNVPVVLHNDVFTMTAGTTATFYPLSNDENIKEDFGGVVESGGLPFKAQTGSGKSWTVVSPPAGVYTTTYVVYPTNGPSKSAQITLNVLPGEEEPPLIEMILHNDTFAMLEGTNVSFYPLYNDQGVDQESELSIHTESLPFQTEVGFWGSWKIISPTAGIYTTTYTVSPVNGSVQSAQIVLTVVPRPKPVVLVTDLITSTEGADFSFNPLSNDSGYTLADVESFNVSHSTPLSVTWDAQGLISITNVPAGKYLLNYEIVIFSRKFSGYITLIVAPKAPVIEEPTAEEPTVQPSEPFRQLLPLIRN